MKAYCRLCREPIDGKRVRYTQKMYRRNPSLCGTCAWYAKYLPSRLHAEAKATIARNARGWNRGVL